MYLPLEVNKDNRQMLAYLSGMRSSGMPTVAHKVMKKMPIKEYTSPPQIMKSRTEENQLLYSSGKD